MNKMLLSMVFLLINHFYGVFVPFFFFGHFKSCHFGYSTDMSISAETTPLFSPQTKHIHSQPLTPTGEDPRQRNCDNNHLLSNTQNIEKFN